MFASFAVCPRRRRASERVGAGCVVSSVPLGTAFRACRVCLVCGAVPWGLLLGVLRVRRCAMKIAGGRVAWVAPCLEDCWWACRVGGAVCWGLLTRALSGLRRVFGFADRGLVAVLVQVAAGVLASQNGSFGKAALVQNRHFWVLVRVRGLGRSKAAPF